MKSQTKTNGKFHRSLENFILQILIFSLISATTALALAAPAILKWNRVYDNRVVGYRIYFGTISKEAIGNNDCQFYNYTPNNRVEVNNVNTTELPIIREYFDLEPNQSYFFIVRSVDAYNDESCDSNEKKYIVPSDYNFRTLELQFLQLLNILK